MLIIINKIETMTGVQRINYCAAWPWTKQQNNIFLHMPIGWNRAVVLVQCANLTFSSNLSFWIRYPFIFDLVIYASMWCCRHMHQHFLLRHRQQGHHQCEQMCETYLALFVMCSALLHIFSMIIIAHQSRIGGTCRQHPISLYVAIVAGKVPRKSKWCTCQLEGN